MRVQRSVVYRPADAVHRPTVTVLARSHTGFELVATSAYFSHQRDNRGPYRVRRSATVAFRRNGTRTDDALVLWRGAFAMTRLAASPHLGEICEKMGVSRDTLLDSLARDHTIFFEKSDL